MLLTRRQRMKVHVKSCTYSTLSENDTRETGTSDETKYHSVTVPSESLIAGEDDPTSETAAISEDHFAPATPVSQKQPSTIQLEASFPLSPIRSDNTK